VRNFASELEREKTSSRTYEHLALKASAGKPAGGISYGYSIIDKQMLCTNQKP
jgi:DNA invertase Pin-like site-specific DNA recombinase